MELRTEEMPDGIRVVILAGRMDIPGTQQVDESFRAIAASQKGLVVVDLADVSFMATIGMRTLVSSAKSLMTRGGAMALAKPQAGVRSALIAAGIQAVIPIYDDVAAASRALQATQRPD